MTPHLVGQHPPTSYTANQTDVVLQRGKVTTQGGEACLREVPAIGKLCFKGDGSFTVTLRKIPTDSGPTAPSDILTQSAGAEGELEFCNLGPGSGLANWPAMNNGAPDSLGFSLELGGASRVTLVTRETGVVR